MYKFKTKPAATLYENLVCIVPIEFRIDNSMNVNSAMDFDEQRQSVVVKYKSTAEEQIDIIHELLHVRMQFSDAFPLLAWQKSDMLVTDEIRTAVKHIRNIADDTYIFHALYDEFHVFPISPNFFRQCRKDNKTRKRTQVQSETGINRVLVGAWRLRIAKLALERFSAQMTVHQKNICEEFLSLLTDKGDEIDHTFSFLNSNVTQQAVATTMEHGKTLERLRDHLGLSAGLLHLAKWEKRGQNWTLTRI